MYSLDDAYEYGFLSDDQTKISTDQMDFDLFASWIVTTPSAEREALLDNYSLLREKYQIVSNMFRKEGVILEDISEKWMNSPLHP